MGKITRLVRIFLGAAIWLSLVGIGWWAISDRGPDGIVQRELVTSLWDYGTGARRVAELKFEASCRVAAGDPIFIVDGPDDVRQVGEISLVAADATVPSIEAIFYTSAPEIAPNARLTYHQTPGSMDWVLRTMLPEAKRKQIANELKTSFEQHREEVIGLMRPIVEEALQDAFSVVEQDLPVALQRRNAELEKLGGRYQRELVERELVPLVRGEIWPIVRKHAEPEVNRIGQELWQRASLWRFGWRYAYDIAPLPQKDLAKREWERFLKDEAVPVLEGHSEDFMRAQEQIFRDVARNTKVQAAVRRSVTKVVKDPGVQKIACEVIQEVVLDNPRLRGVMERHWHSERTQAALRVTSARLEPTAVRIGELLLGTPDGGVTPEFARVLRNQILFKDRRWFVLENGTVSAGADVAGQLTLRVTPGSPDAVNPFVQSLPGRRGV
jgi:hypothetical protein